MANSEKPSLLPRPGLREPNFRRFEPVMRAALTEPQTLTESQLDGVSPRSWVVMFNDARRGCATYQYSTDLSPETLAQIQARETAEGGVYVHVRKRKVDRLKAAFAEALGPPVKASLSWRTERSRCLEVLEQARTLKSEVVISWGSQSELEDLLAACSQAGVEYPLTDSKRKVVIIPIPWL